MNYLSSAFFKSEKRGFLLTVAFSSWKCLPQRYRTLTLLFSIVIKGRKFGKLISSFGWSYFRFPKQLKNFKTWFCSIMTFSMQPKGLMISRSMHFKTTFPHLLLYMWLEFRKVLKTSTASKKVTSEFLMERMGPFLVISVANNFRMYFLSSMVKPSSLVCIYAKSSSLVFLLTNSI